MRSRQTCGPCSLTGWCRSTPGSSCCRRRSTSQSPSWIAFCRQEPSVSSARGFPWFSRSGVQRLSRSLCSTAPAGVSPETAAGRRHCHAGGQQVRGDVRPRGGRLCVHHRQRLHQVPDPGDGAGGPEDHQVPAGTASPAALPPPLFQSGQRESGPHFQTNDSTKFLRICKVIFKRKTFLAV